MELKWTQNESKNGLCGPFTFCAEKMSLILMARQEKVVKLLQRDTA